MWFGLSLHPKILRVHTSGESGDKLRNLGGNSRDK